MKKSILPLILGIGIPVFFVIIIVLMALLPSLSIKPQHDFLFFVDEHKTSGGYALCFENRFTVSNNQINLIPNVSPCPDRAMTQAREYPDIYYYNIKNGTVTIITLKEAEMYRLIPGPSSPDGYTVSYEYSNYSFGLFGGGGNNSGYMIGNAQAKKSLPGIEATARYGRDIQIIGWVHN